MKIEVYRYNSQEKHTNSLLLIDGKYQCEGLEDQFNNVKIHGETRIPDGIYPLQLRGEGGFNNRYLERFGAEFHKGMIQISKIQNFKHVLIHIGNSDKDTSGCYLVGFSDGSGKNWISNSKKAYKKIYPKIVSELLNECEVTIEFKTIG